MFESFKPKTLEAPALSQESIEDNSVGIFDKIDSLYRESPFSFKTALIIASMTAAFSANADETSYNPVLENIQKNMIATNIESADSMQTVIEAQHTFNEMVKDFEQENYEKDWAAQVSFSGLAGEEVAEKIQVPELPQSGSGNLEMKSGLVNGSEYNEAVKNEQIYIGAVYNYTIDNLSETYALTGEEFSDTITVDVVPGMSAAENILSALETSVRQYVETSVSGAREIVDEEMNITNSQGLTKTEVSQRYKSTIESSVNVLNLAWEIIDINDDNGNIKEYLVTYHILPSK